MQKRASKYRIYRGIYASRKSVAICTASMPVALRLLKLPERCIYTFSALENDKNTLNLCMQRYTQSHMYNMIDRLTSIQTKIYTQSRICTDRTERRELEMRGVTPTDTHSARAHPHTLLHTQIYGLLTRTD